MQAPRACDRCYRIRVRCVRRVENEACERCHRLSHQCRTDRAVLQPGRPSKRRPFEIRSPARHVDDVSTRTPSTSGSPPEESPLGESSPEDFNSLSLMRAVDPLTRAVHGFQQQEIRRLEYFFADQHLDEFVNKTVYGTSFHRAMKVILVSHFLDHPAALKDAFLACDAAITVSTNKSAASAADRLQVMRRTSSAVSSLQWANPTRVEDVASVLALAMLITTVNDLVIGQSTKEILRSALMLASPWSELIAQPSSPWFDLNIMNLLFAEMHECLLHGEIPVFRFEYNGLDTYLDRYYGICYRLLPILYDICVLANRLRLAPEASVAAEPQVNSLLKQLDLWPSEPAIEDIEEHGITAQELRHIVRQAWCYRAMAKILLCYLVPTSSARRLVGQVFSEDIRNEIQTSRKYASGGGQYLIFPYFIGCFDLTDVDEQKNVLTQMTKITEDMAPQPCQSMYRFLQYIWSVRPAQPNASWQSLLQNSPAVALGP